MSRRGRPVPVSASSARVPLGGETVPAGAHVAAGETTAAAGKTAAAAGKTAAAAGKTAAVAGENAAVAGKYVAVAGETRAVAGSRVGSAGNGSPVARFGEQVLRLAMEVVDGRRAAGQLRPVADTRALEAIRTMVGRAPGRELGTATGIRMHRPHVDDAGAELFATYRRGPRYFAIAARVDRVADGWRLTAFRLC
ncbi:Rv3235 family protein [Nocardia thailandica]|uniref:Rv3235 family protein n=1 Tax=Nocardia thailandica TaxID=257275 RepID=UPI0002ED0828|nr:Rv3235 family protein [Nocardia thailandica]